MHGFAWLSSQPAGVEERNALLAKLRGGNAEERREAAQQLADQQLESMDKIIRLKPKPPSSN